MSLYLKSGDIFEAVPVGIWKQDFREIKREIEELQKQGVEDIPAWIDTHPDEVYQWLKLIRVIDLNQEIVRLFEGTDKQDIIANRGKIRTPGLIEGFKKSLKSYLRGECECIYDGTAKTLKGRRIRVRFRARLVDPDGWTLVYFACHDNTSTGHDRHNIESALVKLASTLEKLEAPAIS